MKPTKAPSEDRSTELLPWNATMYRIGDYAKYLGVTPDFLKHYEQFRVVSSETKENGYRYYPFGQSYKILECMRLRNYGISLRDIDVALVDDDADTVMEKLNARVKVIEDHIRFEQAIVQEHQQMHQWYERMKDKEEDWFVGQSEEMLFLPHTSRRNFLKDSRIYDILGDWLAMMPLVKSSMRVPKPTDFRLPMDDYAWGLLVPVSVAEAFPLPINDAVLRLPPRKTFFYHFSGKTWPQLNPKDLLHSDIHKMMSQLGLSPADDIYMTMHMYTHINTDSLRFGYYAVPIE